MSENNETPQPERKPGDWAYRARQQRAEAREEARQRRDEDPNYKWYESTGWIILILLVFWPIGLILAWRSNWPVAAKIAATVAILAIVVGAYAFNQNVAYLASL